MEIVAVLRCNLGRFVKYQIGTKLLLAVILMPLFHWSVKMLMKSRGLDYIANGLVQKFLISPQGILLMVIGAAFALSVVLIELGGLIVLSHQAIFGVSTMLQNAAFKR